jgi:hypothetical protein
MYAPRRRLSALHRSLGHKAGGKRDGVRTPDGSKHEGQPRHRLSFEVPAMAVARVFGRAERADYQNEPAVELSLTSAAAPMLLADVIGGANAGAATLATSGGGDGGDGSLAASATRDGGGADGRSCGGPKQVAFGPNADEEAGGSGGRRRVKPDAIKFVAHVMRPSARHADGGRRTSCSPRTPADDAPEHTYVLHFGGGRSSTNTSMLVKKWQDAIDEHVRTHHKHSTLAPRASVSNLSAHPAHPASLTNRRSSWLFGSSTAIVPPDGCGGEGSSCARSESSSTLSGDLPTSISLWVGTWNAGEKRLDAEQVA